jgi:hypothetical protein
VNFSTKGKILKSSGSKYSSSSESQADAFEEEDVGEDVDDPGENDASSRSSRWSSDPIFSFGTRCDFWK